MIKVQRAREYVKDGESTVALKDKSNCTVYAFASSFDVDYETASKEMTKRFGRIPKKGVPLDRLVGEFVAMKETGEVIEGRKVTEVITQPKKQTKWKLGGDYKLRKTRLKTFLKEYKEGTFYIVMRQHAFTIKDGTVIDTITREYPEKVIIKYAFRIETANAYTIEPAPHAVSTVVPSDVTREHSELN